MVPPRMGRPVMTALGVSFHQSERATEQGFTDTLDRCYAQATRRFAPAEKPDPPPLPFAVDSVICLLACGP